MTLYLCNRCLKVLWLRISICSFSHSTDLGRLDMFWRQLSKKIWRLTILQWYPSTYEIPWYAIPGWAVSPSLLIVHLLLCRSSLWEVWCWLGWQCLLHARDVKVKNQLLMRSPKFQKRKIIRLEQMLTLLLISPNMKLLDCYFLFILNFIFSSFSIIFIFHNQCWKSLIGITQNLSYLINHLIFFGSQRIIYFFLFSTNTLIRNCREWKIYQKDN